MRYANLTPWVACFALMIAHPLCANASYIEEFNQYRQWKAKLPGQADPAFITFIQKQSPLANRLRNKWLYQQGKNQEWEDVYIHYQKSKNTSLNCFYYLAAYHQGDVKLALTGAKKIWMTGQNLPDVCDPLFKILLSHKSFDESLLKKRIRLALEKRNLGLARHLLNQFNPPRTKDAKQLSLLYHQPQKITLLETGELHDEFYTYGLKRMVSKNMEKAIRYWRHVKDKNLLPDANQQSFLRHVALYKAMRGHSDAYEWFKKVKPAYHHDVLVDWQIRFAIKNHQWSRVRDLILQWRGDKEPKWIYWLARSYEATGQKQKALRLFQAMAGSRHYYGFLASRRLNTNLSFENEQVITDPMVLSPYQGVLDEIKGLYQSKKKLQAARLLHDFATGLSKDELSALAYWTAQELKWPSQTVYLSNTNEVLNDQLALRFPISYKDTISTYAKRYTVQPALIYAIIRQESGFRKDVVSTAGARGLMQVMPGTAKMVAKNSNIAYRGGHDLFKKKKNINIGVAYLNQLSERFNHHPVLMAAAYNAGPRQVDYWLKNHSHNEVDIWIETLPWHETRNYLKNVISFYAVYRYRLDKRPDIDKFLKPIP